MNSFIFGYIDIYSYQGGIFMESHYGFEACYIIAIAFLKHSNIEFLDCFKHFKKRTMKKMTEETLIEWVSLDPTFYDWIPQSCRTQEMELISKL